MHLFHAGGVCACHSASVEVRDQFSRISSPHHRDSGNHVIMLGSEQLYWLSTH